MRVRALVSTVLLIGVFAGLFAPSARAQTKLTPEQLDRARRHYLNALSAEKAGNIDEAVREFISAYEITKDPKLFYQIAHAYENGGRKEEALVFYRRYLNEASLSPQAREEIRDKITTLQGTPPPPPTPAPSTPPSAAPGANDAILPPPDEPPHEGKEPVPPPAAGPSGAAAGEPPAPPAEAPPTFLDEESGWRRTAGWISVGVAAAFLTTGAVLASSAASREEDVRRLLDYRDPTTGLPPRFQGTVAEDYADATEEGESFNTWSTVAFVGAGVAAGAAITFFVLDAVAKPNHSGDGAAPAPPVTLVPHLGPNAAGVSAAWEF